MSQSIDIAPHLQRVLDTMSKDLAVEPEVLVNQAVHAWLRLNGYGVAAAVPAVEAPALPQMSSSPTPAPVAVPEVPAPVVVAAAPAPVPAVTADLGPALARMAEIDADLEKLARPLPAWAPVQAEEEEEEEEAEEPVAAAAPPEVEAPEAPEEPDAPALDGNTGETAVEEPDESTIVLRSVPIALYLEREGEEPVKVTSDRFIIGRGPHCDLVIDSPRVSREHVALTRKGILFYLEDLNSSNGTWLGEERVTRRELESGDVINLGNEPVTFFLRGE